MTSFVVMQVKWFALAGYLAVLVQLAASTGPCDGMLIDNSDGSYTWSSPNFGGDTYPANIDCLDTIESDPANEPQKYKVTIDVKTFGNDECETLDFFGIDSWFYEEINLCDYAQGDIFYLEVGASFDFLFESGSMEEYGQFQMTIEEVDSPGCHVYKEIGAEGKKSHWFRSPKTNKRYNVDHACEVVVKTVNDKKECVKFIGTSHMMGPAECPGEDDDLLDFMAVSLTNDDEFDDTDDEHLVCGRRKFHFISTGDTMRMLWATDEDHNSISRRGLKGKFVAVRCPTGRRRRRRASRPIHIRGKPFLISHKSDD